MSDRLWFERLELERMPGLERGGFTISDLSPGVNVIHGPNGSGKTTTARAIDALLWPDRLGRPDRGKTSDRRVRAALRIGRVPWEIELDRDREIYRADGEPVDRPALPPADVADRYHLTLQDLLATEGAAGASGERFARQIAEELAGGFDFQAAREAVHARQSPGLPKTLRDRFLAARARAQEVEETQRRLLDEEAELESLERELERSRGAARELEGVEARLAWLDARAAAEEAARRLASFSPAVERLAGDESEQAADLEERARRERDAVEQIRQRIAAEERRRDAAKLPPDGVSGELLEELRRRSETLERLDDRLGREAERLARGRERRERARRGLLTDPAGAGQEPLPLVSEPDLEEPDLPAWEAVVDLARRWEIYRGETAQEARVEEWIGGVETAAVAERLDRLRDATRILRRWLRRPGGAWSPRLPALSAALALIGAGVGAVLTGFGAGLTDVGQWWGGGLIVAGVIVLLWSLLERRAARRQRAELTAEYEGLRRGDDALAAPPSWSAAEVAALLDDLERQLAEGRLEEEKALRWRGLRERREDLAARGAALTKERDALLERLGAVPALGSEVDPAPLASFVEALSAWREATVEVAEAEAARSDLEGERARVLERIGRDFERLGDAPPADAIEVASRIAALGDRAGEHRRAREALAALEGPEGELARAETRRRETEEELAGLYRQLDLEPLDRAGLSALLEQLDGFRAARDAAGEAHWKLSEAEEALAGLGLVPSDGDAEMPETPDRDALEVERQGLMAKAAQVENLIRRIQDLETRTRTARGGHDLEDALADLESAKRSLLRARTEEARRVVAWRLTAWLRRAAGRSHRPAVLHAASNLFTRFTRGRYRLLDPEGDPPVFRARESDSGLIRRLDELSAGTRVQLLIAVRLAFAESQEQGLRLPLVLDETLANSDEWAAEAVMAALLEVAGPDGGSGGRQIVYFTAQQDEVAKWRVALASDSAHAHCQIIDLAEVRQRKEADERPWAEIERARPQVPAPGGMDREEYARVLGVPGIDPARDVGSLHLWYVVDDPEVLHRLLSNHVDRWGRLATLLDTGGGENLLGGGEEARRRARTAAARAQCVEAIAKAWRQGRGRRLDRGVLIDSGAVSDVFLDEVSDLTASLDGDPERLIEALRKGEVKRFQTAKIEQLEEFLTDRGYLDDRPVLDREEILTRVLGALSQQIDAGDLTLRDVEDLFDRTLS